jgi:hypothetical protein
VERSKRLACHGERAQAVSCQFSNNFVKQLSRANEMQWTRERDRKGVAPKRCEGVQGVGYRAAGIWKLGTVSAFAWRHVGRDELAGLSGWCQLLASRQTDRQIQDEELRTSGVSAEVY